MARAVFGKFLGWATGAALALGGAAQAEITWDERFFNPKPLDGDVTMPMPCGGAMVFRPVETSNPDGAIGDVPVILGEVNEAQPYLTGLRRAFVSGPFSQDGTSARSYFYMAKYEIAEAQYEVVMSGCPDSDPRRAAFRPVVDVSKLELETFAERYTLWLMQNAPESLPETDTTRGFVRLPTEDEWEYATRGGLAASDTDFRAPRPPVPEGRQASEYIAHGGADSAGGRLQPIGTLEPNVLGLHDTLGNAAEIVGDSFALVRHGRLHGLAGGFIKRGGDARTPLASISSASRFEVPPFDIISNTVSADRYTGGRMVISGLAITSAAQAEEIIRSLEELAQADAGLQNAGSEEEVLKLLDDMVAESTSQLATARLGIVKQTIEQGRAERNTQRDRSIRLILTASTLLCDQSVQRYLNALAIALFLEDLEEMEQTPEVREEIEFTLESLRGLEQRAADSAQEYANFVEGLASDYSAALLSRQIAYVGQQPENAERRRALCFSAMEAHMAVRLAEGFSDADTISEDFQSIALLLAEQ